MSNNTISPLQQRENNALQNKLNKAISMYINRTIIISNLFFEATSRFISLTFDLHTILHVVWFKMELFRAPLPSFYINENII